MSSGITWNIRPLQYHPAHRTVQRQLLQPDALLRSRRWAELVSSTNSNPPRLVSKCAASRWSSGTSDHRAAFILDLFDPGLWLNRGMECEFSVPEATSPDKVKVWHHSGWTHRAASRDTEDLIILADHDLIAGSLGRSWGSMWRHAGGRSDADYVRVRRRVRRPV